MSSKSKLLDGFLRKPYGLLDSRLFKWLFILTGPVLSFLFVIIKKPKILALLYTDQEVYLITLLYSLILAIIWILHLNVLQRVLFKELNFLKTLIWLVWINLLSGLFNFVFIVMTLFDKEFDWYFFPEILMKTLYFGGAVTIIFIVLFSAKKYLSQDKA